MHPVVEVHVVAHQFQARRRAHARPDDAADALFAHDGPVAGGGRDAQPQHPAVQDRPGPVLVGPERDPLLAAVSAPVGSPGIQDKEAARVVSHDHEGMCAHVAVVAGARDHPLGGRIVGTVPALVDVGGDQDGLGLVQGGVIMVQDGPEAEIGAEADLPRLLGLFDVRALLLFRVVGSAKAFALPAMRGHPLGMRPVRTDPVMIEPLDDGPQGGHALGPRRRGAVVLFVRLGLFGHGEVGIAILPKRHVIQHVRADDAVVGQVRPAGVAGLVDRCRTIRLRRLPQGHQVALDVDQRGQRVPRAAPGSPLVAHAEHGADRLVRRAGQTHHQPGVQCHPVPQDRQPGLKDHVPPVDQVLPDGPPEHGLLGVLGHSGP